MTFARVVLAAATNDPVPEPKTTSLPPEQTMRALVRFYETSILPLYPVFHRSSLHALVSELYEEENPRSIRSSEYWLFWMVLAIGSAAQSRSKRDESYLNAVEFVARALPHADRALMSGYVTQLQSLLLLTQYSMLDPAHFDCWNLIGFTCRAVVDLGLHQDPPNIQQLDQDALDARRRTFYCAYALDRSAARPQSLINLPNIVASRAISMVHARAFSFYDDALSVGLPSPNYASSTLSTGSSVAQPSLPDASVFLFRLRQLESEWYQTLFQCNPNDPLPDATFYIWQKCFEMREWSEGLPHSLPIDIREMLDLELRYSYVYCIAPCARAPHLSAYGKMLIFEHAIGYADRIYEAANSVTSRGFYTYHDALRVYFMGSQFVSVLRDAGDLVLSGSPIPMPHLIPGKPPPPLLPERVDRGGGDNLERSLRCLGRLRLTLKLYGDRWEDALSLMETFEMMSAEVLESLKARQVAREAAEAARADNARNRQRQPLSVHQPVPNSVSATQHYSPLPPHTQQLPPQGQEMRWVDVDVAQIIRGGGHI